MAKTLTKIESALEYLEIPHTKEQAELLLAYHDYILKRNDILRLISETSSDSVLFHIFDSLVGYPFLKKYNFQLLADIGSGGGFPGIPLAILFSDKEFLLIEKSSRRAGFLRACVASLGIASRVTIVEDELKNIDTKVDGAVFRAFRQIDEFFLQIANIVKPEGFIFAYKGKKEETQRELLLLKENPKFSENFGFEILFSDKTFSPAERSFLFSTKIQAQ
ncbi:MAG: 16S rRNA (guanine(527)-N(7))-methyltransferase RsmG [Spirochaetales bacterium]|nr:16S rRNA (guanine(527)-N(7))-methyltransferase RsmG [Spirochaetales bacterium]